MDELIAVALFENAVEAGRAKDRLGYLGIQSVLRHHGLKGQIQLEVPQKDAQAALDFLDQKTWQIPRGPEEETAFATARTLALLPPAREEDEDEKPLSPREKLATKTFRMAIFGLVFPLLLPVALLLFGRLCFSKGELQGLPRRHAKFAGVILGCLLLFPLALCAGVLFFPSDEVNLRDLPHPDVLVGNWAGQRTFANDEVTIEMELRPDGKLRYQESGALGVDAIGTWAYVNYSLCIRLDRFKEGTRPWQGKIVGWELKRCTDHDMILKEGDGELRLHRQR
jgi:hypothetical protein